MLRYLLWLVIAMLSIGEVIQSFPFEEEEQEVSSLIQLKVSLHQMFGFMT